MVHLIGFLSRSPAETRDFGRTLGGVLSCGDVVALRGALGSGKSILARGILESLGVEGDMPSPSFVIVATYDGRVKVHHIDLYRLEEPADAWDLGLQELMFSDALCVVEWADRVEGFLPPRTIDVELRSSEQPDHRLIALTTGDRDVGSRLMDLAKTMVRFSGR
jgi:tRNA threonylcarbamoyladenosine biosynthesis protein TsaE